MKQSGWVVLVAALAAMAAAVAQPALADDGTRGQGYGVRLGFSFDPDQFVLGLQGDTGPVFRVAHLVPSVDVGFGDNLTTFAFNADVVLELPLPQSSASLYGGAGPTLVYWKPDEGDGDLEVGLSLVVGARLPLASEHAYNVEARFGVSDVPDVRVLLGILFGAGK